MQKRGGRHSEERSAEAIQFSFGRYGLLRCARNDGGPISQQARSTLGLSPTISGCCASATAGESRITSAWAPKIAAAR